MNVTTLRNVGLNKGTHRIWLEGNKLDLCGFCAGVRYTVKVNRETIKLTLCEDGEKRVMAKTIDPDLEYKQPIIDIHNTGLGVFLDGAVQVTVTYKVNEITIKRVKP